MLLQDISNRTKLKCPGFLIKKSNEYLSFSNDYSLLIKCYLLDLFAVLQFQTV